MFIISNNCLGGYIYRDILEKEYCSPFIWTLFDTNVFIDFVNDCAKFICPCTGSEIHIKDKEIDVEETKNDNEDKKSYFFTVV